MNGAESAESLLVGQSETMRELRRIIRQVAPSTASVLLTGPSGSGKEVVARAIRAESRRVAKSYVAVNCGAIPRDLIESELFGHEKGSFTGAVSQRRGRFEEANGGTLFLDEIGDMPFDMQVKLLRVLEDRTIQRVGGSGQIAVDTRVISATHRDIHAQIEGGKFREDLYYRLSVFPIDIPSLAERREDVQALASHFLTEIATRDTPTKLLPAAMLRLAYHDWPGNVRELRNVIERACILFPGQSVGAEQIELAIGGRRRAPDQAARALQEIAVQRPQPPVLTLVEAPREAAPPAEAETAFEVAVSLDDGPVDLRTLVTDLESRYIAEALRQTEGVVAEAARLLSLKRTTLIEKMRKHGVAEAA